MRDKRTKVRKYKLRKKGKSSPAPRGQVPKTQSYRVLRGIERSALIPVPFNHKDLVMKVLGLIEIYHG